MKKLILRYGLVLCMVTIGGAMRAAQPSALTLDEQKFLQAAGEGDIKTVSALLEQGVNVNARDNFGNTALMILLSEGDDAVIIDTLLNHIKSDINARNRGGYSALMIAARKGYSDIVRSLLARGARIDAVLANGETVLSYAARPGNQEVLRILMVHPAVDQTVIDETIVLLNERDAKQLLDVWQEVQPERARMQSEGEFKEAQAVLYPKPFTHDPMSIIKGYVVPEK